jgi:teichuronic acid biosynthesis glycosyltransferase TuaG
MSNLVSVIMPYYRKRKYIKKAVYSVINQSYKKWELIIVYDDSDRKDLDYLKDIIKKHKRIILLVNKKNMGAAYSRNLAIKKSKGNFLAFLDADDYWSKNKILLQLDLMKKNNLLFSHTSYKIITKNNSTIYRKANNLLTYDDLLKSCDICLSSVMISNKLILNKYKCFPNLKTKEDYALWLKYAKKNVKIYGYNRYLTTWRETINSLSSSVVQKLCDALRVYYKFENMNLFNSIKSTYILSLNYLKKNT